MIIPIFLTGLGCSREACSFCDQEIATSKSRVTTDENIKNRIENTLKEYLSGRKKIGYPVEVAFYGSNFTALDFSYQKELINFIQEVFEDITKRNHKDTLRIRISTRPDCIKKEELLDLKIRFNLHLVEIGVQSMNDEVLFLARRGHSRRDVMRAARDIKKIGLELSCHQMIGLPGSNLKYERTTARDIVKLKPKYVRVHPTLVFKGTLLEKMHLSGDYIPMSLDEAVDTTEKVVTIYRRAGIEIIRMGLHPSELLLRSIVAGPWHPAFRELVEGRYLMHKASDQLSGYRGKRVELRIAPKDETYIRGENNSNYNQLIDSFNLKGIDIIKDPEIKRGDVSINHLN